MSKHTIYSLTAIFLILVIWTAQPLWQPYLTNFNPIANPPSPAVKLNQQADNLSKIVISKASTEIVLEKSDSTWQVQGFPISKRHLDMLLSDLKSVEFPQIASTNPDNFSSYDATPSAGIKVDFFTPSDSSSWLVGTTGPQPNTYYIKPETENIVYLAQGTLRDLLVNDLDDWRDKTIFNITPDQLTKIEILRNGTSITISKNDQNQWTAVSGSKTAVLGDTISDRLITSFDPLEATGFADSSQQRTFSNTNRKNFIHLFTDQDQPVLELNLIEQNGIWLGQSQLNEQIFTLNPIIVNSFLLTPQDIFVSTE